MTREEKLQRASQIIKESKYLVCLLGMRVSYQSGCTNIGEPEDAYDIESRYGYSPEELFSAAFYNTRPSQFYEFYKNEVLSKRGRINEGLKLLGQLEEMGILKSIVTRDIYSLPKRAGCKNVLEIHGSIYRNIRPRCRKKYPLKALQERERSGLPYCEKCGSIIRPEIYLKGEMIDNRLLTKAVDEVSSADVLLMLGCSMRSELGSMFTKYFKGEKIILMNDQDHFADGKADLVIDGKAMDLMKGLRTYMVPDS